MLGMTRATSGFKLGPMTLLGAINLGDRMLMGADAIVHRPDEQGNADYREGVQKLWTHPLCKLIWGCGGDETVALELNDWFRSVAFNSWEELKDQVQEELARRNGEARRLAALAASYRDGATMLVAGYLDTPGIMQLHDAGGYRVIEPGEALFYGGGGGAANTAWQAVRGVVSPATFVPDKIFKYVFNITIGVMSPLGAPPRYLEIRPDGDATESRGIAVTE